MVWYQLYLPVVILSALLASVYYDHSQASSQDGKVAAVVSGFAFLSYINQKERGYLLY